MSGESFRRPNLRMKPVVNPPSQDAEELLVGSLTLLKDLLVKINNDGCCHLQSNPSPTDGYQDSDSNSDPLKTVSRPLLARSFISELTSLFSSMKSGASPTGSTLSDASLYLGAGLGNGTLTGLNLPPMLLQKNKAALPPATGINSAAQSLGQGLTSSVVGSVNISSVKPMLNVLAASRALSQGLGSGAAGGLNLKKLDMNAFNTSDVPGIAGSFGQGLTSGFLQGVNVKMLAMSMGGQITPEQTNSAALALAEGLGGGAAFASNLSTKPLSNDFGSDPISGVAGNFGQGLSTSFIQDIDIKQLAMMMKPMITPAQMNEAALSFASGLGGGAAYAANLTTTPPSNDFNPDGVSGIAGNVGSGLSVSFIKNINFKAIASSAAGSAPKITRQQMLEAAQGFGTGLAGGAVVGVGLQPASNMPMPDNGGLAPLTDTFARGLSQSFLQNGTALKLVNIVMQAQGQAPKINMLAVAKGFAVGLVDGAQTSIDNAGGLQKVFKISTKDAALMNFPAPMTNIDDGVGGAAFGFANGLASEAVKGVLQVFGNPPIQGTTPAAPVSASNPPNSDSPAPGTSLPNTSLPASTGSTPNSAPNSPGVSMNPITPSNPTAARHKKRQAVTEMSPVPMDVSVSTSSTDVDSQLMMLNQTIGPLLQKGSNVLGCQGIGGLIAIAVSAGMNTNAGADIAKDQAQIQKIQDMIKKLAFLDQTFTVQDRSGNTIQINIARFILLINGNSLVKEILTLTGHITIAIITFAIVIPTILIINSIHNFALMTGRTNVLTKATKIQWGLALFIVLPSLIGILVLGVLGDGARSHFQTLHGALGLILLFFTFSAFPLAYFRSESNAVNTAFKANLALILFFTTIELTSGFSDLSTITSCALQFLPQFLFVSLGFTLAAPMLQAITLITLELIINRWRKNAPDAYIDDEKSSLKSSDTSTPGSFMNI
ncbi:hypothetical protein K3495_g5409 [Podosphaera aphanis]|nr:hypothetical protein K3495_g5409 [Podosphaera aphanis]